MITTLVEVLKPLGRSEELQLRALGHCGLGRSGHDEIAERWARQCELHLLGIGPLDRVALVLFTNGEPTATADCEALEHVGALLSLLGAMVYDDERKAA